MAHEYLGRTDLSTYSELQAWIRERLPGFLDHGFEEWGSNYTSSTFMSLLNLAELAADEDTRRLALAAVDLYVGLQGVQSVGTSFAAGRVRTYRSSWAVSTPGQTTWAEALFDAPITDDPAIAMEYATDDLAVFVSNWSPFDVHRMLFDDRSAYEAKHRNASRSLYFSTDGHFALGTIQSTDERLFLDETVTHDVFSVFVTTAAGQQSFVTPYGLPMADEPAPSKIISLHERSFGFEDVAFVHHGGDTRGVWTGGGVDDVPIRLYVAEGFGLAPIIEQGWVFVQDAAGEVFVGWAPTMGDPVDAGEVRMVGNEPVGYFVRSTAEQHFGETAVVEVGSIAGYADFDGFRSEVLARNPRPRIAGADGALSYVTRSGTTLRWGPDSVEVDGVAVDWQAYPFNASPFGDGLELAIGGSMLTIDPRTGAETGPAARLDLALQFGTP